MPVAAHRTKTPRDLDELELQLRQVSEVAERLASAIDLGTLARRPAPESWSVAECLVHLNLTAEAYFPVWERELTRAHRQNLRGEYRYRMDVWGKILAWTLEPPPRFRFRAPRAFHPIDTGPVETVLSRFLDRQGEILRYIHASRGLAIDKMKIVSPFDRRLRYSVWSSFCVNVAHERRHLWQAEQAVRTFAK